MRYFSFKLLSIFLITAILYISIPAHQVSAGPVFVFAAIVTAVATTATVAYDYFSCNFNVLWGGCGGDNGSIIARSASGCVIPLTFYNPRMNQDVELREVLNPDYGKGGLGCFFSGKENCWNRYLCVPNAIDETQRQVAIYRLTLPTSASQNAFGEWFMSIDNSVGYGFSDYGSFAGVNRSDSQPLAIVPYANLCSGNVCKFADTTVPQNSYVAYVAKILGNYTPGNPWWGVNTGTGSCPMAPNKFLNNNNSTCSYLPSYHGYNTAGGIWGNNWPSSCVVDTHAGNAVVGIFQTGNCSPPLPISGSCGNAPSFCEIPDSASLCSVGTLASAPVLSESTWNWTCNGSNGGSDASCGASYCLPVVGLSAPSIVEYPNNINLTWTSTHADSCSASGDWSGSKSASGTEPISKPRGAYTFTLTCKGLGGTSLPASATVKVIKVPKCSFFPTPSKIILPQSSTLSWSCEYADNCAIDQGIGSISNTSGSHQVRPSKTTTYTLTCSSPDASRSYTAKIDVGATPDLKEINPR